jgi:hypothetical protein
VNREATKWRKVLDIEGVSSVSGRLISQHHIQAGTHAIARVEKLGEAEELCIARR